MKAQTAFAVAFLTVLFIPPLLLDWTSLVSQKENRILASKPVIIVDGNINKNYFSQFDAWISDHFGLRSILIALDAAIDQRSSSEFMMTDRSLQGKDGWIFYTDDDDGQNLADFYKINQLNEVSLAKIERNVRESVEWFMKHGIKVLYFIAPNKHSVYGEYYPFGRPDGITRADQITTAIASGGADCIFPRDLLLQRKETAPFRLYFKTDTHWNALGAYYASEALLEKIEIFFPEIQFPNISYRINIENDTFCGDLVSMLNKPGMEERRVVNVAPDGSKLTDFYEYIKNDGRDGVHTLGTDKSLPRAIVFRDSFFSALEPFVSPLFSEAEYIWKDFTDADKEWILTYKPDVVVFERVERAAQNLGFVR